MVIQYTVKLDKDGVTVTERIEGCGGADDDKAGARIRGGTDIGSSMPPDAKRKTEGAAVSHKVRGGGSYIIAFGPVVIQCDDDSGGEHDKPGPDT